MKLTKTQKTSIKVTILFTVAILSTFIGEYFSDFLGDWKCQGYIQGKLIPETQLSYSHFENLGCDYGAETHISTIHWGYRHWIYLTMCITLFVIQCLDIINSNKK